MLQYFPDPDRKKDILKHSIFHFAFLIFHYLVPGLHHYHFRKRQELGGLETRLIRAFDKVIYVVAIIGPLTTLPQVFKIWSAQNAQGISTFTWCAYVVLNLFWITYGMIHRERPIIITYCLWVVVNGSIAIGAMLYG